MSLFPYVIISLSLFPYVIIRSPLYCVVGRGCVNSLGILWVILDLSLVSNCESFFCLFFMGYGSFLVGVISFIVCMMCVLINLDYLL